MKKLIILMLAVISFTAQAQAQVKVLGKIIPNGVIDQYPTHIDSLGQGGLMVFKTWQERNTIPTPRRKAGMVVRVKSASVDSTYSLGVGLTNNDWYPFAPPIDISGKEDKSNKVTTLTSPNDTTYPTTKAVSTALNDKANSNNPTFQGNAVFSGSGNITVQGGGQNQFLRISNTESGGQYMTFTMGNSGAGNQDKAFIRGSSGVNAFVFDKAIYVNSDKIAMMSDFTTLSNELFGKANLNGGNTFTGGDQNIMDGNSLMLTSASGTTRHTGGSYRLANAANTYYTDAYYGQITQVNGNGQGIWGGNRLTLSGTSAWVGLGSTRLQPNTNSSTVIVKVPAIAGELVVDSQLAGKADVADIPKMMVVTASGDGTTYQFTFPHELSYTPTMISGTPMTADASMAYSGTTASTVAVPYYTADATNVTITFFRVDGIAGVPPKNGTNNLKWTLLVK